MIEVDRAGVVSRYDEGASGPDVIGRVGQPRCGQDPQVGANRLVQTHRANPQELLDKCCRYTDQHERRT